MAPEPERSLAIPDIDSATLFHALPFGVALSELICDENGKPVDYQLLDVNNAFQTLFAGSRETFVGKLATGLLDADELKYWLDAFAPIALEGKTVRMEMYCARSMRYLDSTVFSPLKGYFITMFSDITEENEHRHKAVRVRRNAVATSSMGS